MPYRTLAGPMETGADDKRRCRFSDEEIRRAWHVDTRRKYIDALKWVCLGGLGIAPAMVLRPVIAVVDLIGTFILAPIFSKASRADPATPDDDATPESTLK